MNITRIGALFFLLLVPSLAFAKTAHEDNCSGTFVPYKDAKTACKSGKYPGKRIVTCSGKGKLKDSRTCSANNAKKGFYRASCSGDAVGFNTLKAACQSGVFPGEFLVECKNGRQKKRLQCEAALPAADTVVLFKDSCGGSETVSGRDLKKACKNNPGVTLLKCQKKKNIWKEKKSMLCTGKRDRLKVKNCSPRERTTLIGDFELAEERIDVVLVEVEAAVKTGVGMDKAMRKKMAVVRRKLEKIQKAMDRPRTYVCKANKRLCKKYSAHTSGASNVKLCDKYFERTSRAERASILVHEISHYAAKTNDKGSDYGGCATPILAPADSGFEKQADYYEHISECGFYIPE